MEILKDPYVTEKLTLRQYRITDELHSGRISSGFYVITLAANGQDYLDIVPALPLLQTELRFRLPLIVGFGMDREDAVIVVENILKDCLDRRGDLKVRRFLAEKEKEMI